MNRTSDLRVRSFEPLLSPRALIAELPISEAAAETVYHSRRRIGAILDQTDARMLAVVGPCSIHDPVAALDYARRLRALQTEVEDRLFIVMRVYFEKPRTRLGWKGLILDPHLDGSNDIAGGLRVGRQLLLAIAELGLAAGSEMLDPIIPQYIDDLIAWAAIGARTTESQTHREMASGLSMPVGFKNGTDGSVESAVNGLASSLHAHSFVGIDQEGQTCIVTTTGNDMGHVILRGGKSGTNYAAQDVVGAVELLRNAGLRTSVLVDCSHANSNKDYRRQAAVLHDVVAMRRDAALRDVIGFMVESNLVAGAQAFPAGPEGLQYGVSITDPCLGWDETAALLRAVHARLA